MRDSVETYTYRILVTSVDGQTERVMRFVPKILYTVYLLRSMNYV